MMGLALQEEMKALTTRKRALERKKSEKANL
jgi:hypothetical protein